MPEITINVNCKPLDEAIEKADRLRALLQEAQELIDSLHVIQHGSEQDTA